MSAIPLRPLDFGEVLDLGFGLFRRDYRLYMPLALVGLVPATVATVIPTASEIDAEAIVADAGTVLPFFGLLAVGMVFSLLTWGHSRRPWTTGSAINRSRSGAATHVRSPPFPGWWPPVFSPWCCWPR